MSARIDITGERFGRLVALHYVDKTKDGFARWRFKCDCGNEVVTSSRGVRRGTTRSCGCVRAETSAGNLRGWRAKKSPEWSRLGKRVEAILV